MRKIVKYTMTWSTSKETNYIARMSHTPFPY